MVIRDRLCIGDNVQLKYGSGEGRRGIVKHILDQGIVMIEQEFGHVASNVSGSAKIYVRYQLYYLFRLFFRRIYCRSRGSISPSSLPPSTELSVNEFRSPTDI